MTGYDDTYIVDWLRYSFTISRDDREQDPEPAENNHMGANLFPDVIDDYIRTEIQAGATMGLFLIPPFINRIGVSLLSTRPKKQSQKRRIILVFRKDVW